MRNPVPVFERLSARGFFEATDELSRAVVVKGAFDDWPALARWTPEYLAERVGQETIRVEVLPEDRASDPLYYLTRYSTETMSVRAYVQTTRSAPGGRRYLAQSDLLEASSALRRDIGPLPFISRERSLRVFPPVLWLGPAGCVTALHFDADPNIVFQISGRKRWHVFDAAESPKLGFPSPLGRDHFSPVDFLHPDLRRHPEFANAASRQVVLEPGDLLFVPPRWPHAVETLEYSITVNQWFRSRRREPRRRAVGRAIGNQLARLARMLGADEGA